MGRVDIQIPLVTWREGRPRFIASAGHVALGYKGEDLRHGPADRRGRRLGPWFTVEECIAWSQERQAELAAKRAAIAAGETTLRRTAGATRRARADGLVTVGQLVDAFRESPRMRGKAEIEGRKKRKPLSANTIRSYLGSARLLEKFDDGAVWISPVADVTGKALDGILHRVEILHGLAQTRALRAFLSVAFTFGKAKGLAFRNPVSELGQTLPVLEPRVRPAEVDEFLFLVAAFDALGYPDVADGMALGVWTGQHQNDRLALIASRISADGIRFDHSKANQMLLIPVAAFMRPRLDAAKARRKGWKVSWPQVLVEERTRKPWKVDWWRKVFRTLRVAATTGELERDRDGQPTKAARLLLGGIDLRARLAAAGLEPMASAADFRDQDCRDTTLTWLGLAGADRFERAGFSGHAHGKETGVERHYVAIPPDYARRGMAKLEAWFAARTGAIGEEAER